MKHKGYESYFGHGGSFIKQVMAYLLGNRSEYSRRRDNCPEWVKQAALDKAHEKRAMRAEKRLAMAQAGTMQMLVVPKKKKRRLLGAKP